MRQSWMSMCCLKFTLEGTIAGVSPTALCFYCLRAVHQMNVCRETEFLYKSQQHLFWFSTWRWTTLSVSAWIASWIFLVSWRLLFRSCWPLWRPCPTARSKCLSTRTRLNMWWQWQMKIHSIRVGPSSSEYYSQVWHMTKLYSLFSQAQKRRSIQGRCKGSAS